MRPKHRRKIRPKRMRMYNDTIQEMATTIIDTIRRGINQWGKFDRTFTGVVKKKVGGQKYLVNWMGNEYTVVSSIALSTGDTVRVCAPQNNWSDLFVVIKVG